ncbi:MAG: GNAT family N-acetyltransferase [Proteobacteria bacterium]|nr:GNAT family N-acetyltransferase [Pseudomonadota bacterium]
MTVLLQTERLEAVVPTLQNQQNRYLLDSDPVVRKYSRHGILSPEQSKQALIEDIEHYEKYGYTICDIFLKDSQEFIGIAGIIHLKDEVELAYILHQKYWNKGYGTELATAFIDFSLNQIKLKELIGICRIENVSSANIMKKCGMKYRGRDSSDVKAQCDIYYINAIK